MNEFLYSIDLDLLYFFNHSLSSGFLDAFFMLITNVRNWYLAYVILLGICFFKGGSKGKLAVTGVILLIVFCDQFSHNVLKEIFERLRPCKTLDDIITPSGCGGTYSFPSNHAFNNFAAATFFFLLYRNLKWILFISAGLIALSRVYLGLHYPSDVFTGAMLGILFGYLFALLVTRINNFIIEKRKPVI
ncbi:MAG: phosphatase PAP2 family protein [Ignavibacteriales bacterium]|nr:MAG: phosphatase PAP2 family protein [Ignavibacteriales bacterium]